MVSINLIWSLLEAANGGGGRLRYTAPDGIGTAIETGSARAPEHKSMFGPRGALPPLQIEIADAPMPDIDELLRRIDSLQGDMRAEPFAS